MVGGREKTMAYRILRAHDTSDVRGKMKIRYDSMISHDITYVGIIQTARASGMTEFPLPYALTNCHNSLCAVGGTINEDDHIFGLSAAQKYGGIYVPANQAVIHQFAREALAGCGKMILGSDSHTRYGCYGTMGVGEGGGELAKQLLKNTWDIDDPEVVLIWIEGEVPHGVGPHDVAIELVGQTFSKGIVKNRILEFAGPGIEKLGMDFRIGIDVMTTETSALSSIWVTDDRVREYYENIGRPEDFSVLEPEDGAYYDRVIFIDLSKMSSMIALPFHPGNAFTLHELMEEPADILSAAEKECNSQVEGNVKVDLMRNIGPDGKIRVSQGIIVGCSGGMYDNISEAADILRGADIGNGIFNLSVYPASQPVNLALINDGIASDLIKCGAVMKNCFCGPCFGAGDTPGNNMLSIRHATRNFPNREGSRPSDDQIASVALMDARSIAATAANGGVLTAATDVPYGVTPRKYVYEPSIYEKRVWYGFGRAMPETELILGPNITDWPEMPPMGEDLLLEMCAVINDEVTTTDELIPSGETSSYRSNPVRLSDFALSRRCPEYVGLAKKTRTLRDTPDEGILGIMNEQHSGPERTLVASAIFAKKPGDGSAREQAASCQKVLGGAANIAREYATKRYRSNCINWGIVPFILPPGEDISFAEG
ncbi:MAG: hydratase, partial [Eubacteriaceae bacterium]|nr:hydratase [Eubacteriaceae bacterium]